MKWAKGEGERRESVREHDFSGEKKEGRRERPEARKKHAVQRRGSFFLHRERHKEVSLQGGEALRAECLRGQEEQALQGAIRRVSRAAGGQVVLQAAEICATALADACQQSPPNMLKPQHGGESCLGASSC